MKRVKQEKRAPAVCAQCGKDFMAVIRFKQRFCSVQCVGQSRRRDDAKWRDPEYIKEYQRAYQANNRQRINKASVEWGKKNREKRRVISRNCTAKRRALLERSGRVASRKQVQRLLAKAQGHCVYCGEPNEKLTLDHVEPISRGGRHIVSNIVPACQHCNSSKGVKDGPEWAYERFGLDGGARVIWFLSRRSVNPSLYPKWKRKHVRAQYGIEVEIVK